MDVSLTVSQVSRVAVIGANGAGNPLPSICLLANSCHRREHLEGPGLAVGMRSTARIAPPGETHAENTHRLHHVALRWKR